MATEFEVSPEWLLEHSEWEFDYFRRACAKDGDSLPVTLSYVKPWWRRIAEAEGRIEAAKPKPWVPLRGPMLVPDPRGGPGCTFDMG